MKGLRIVCVGKLKAGYWREAAQHYQKLLGQWRKLELTEIRDSTLEPERRPLREGEKILQCLAANDFVIALDEGGQAWSSVQLANKLDNLYGQMNQRPTFIIGGPFGLDQEILRHSRACFSLSALTLTHEMARILLLEQLYRAESILRSTPYHHGAD